MITAFARSWVQNAAFLLYHVRASARTRQFDRGAREIFAVNISARERGSSPRPGARATIGGSPFLVGPLNSPGDREEERARVRIYLQS